MFPKACDSFVFKALTFAEGPNLVIGRVHIVTRSPGVRSDCKGIALNGWY